MTKNDVTATNFEPKECVILVQSNKVGTHTSTFTAAALIAYPNKFPTFLTKLIKYLHNLIEIYMYIGDRLGQRQRQTPVGYWNCGHAERHSVFNTTSK